VTVLLQNWHSSLENAPLHSERLNRAYNATLRELLRAGLLDLRVACPFVDAIHYRNSAAVSVLVNAALGVSVPDLLAGSMQSTSTASSHVGRPGLDAAALARCLQERDAYGQTVLHAASKSKASGFARLFVRQRRASMQSHDEPAANPMASTLRLLKMDAIDIARPITFTTLNAATHVRRRRCCALLLRCAVLY
jgi:hypothetical protein